MLLGFAENIYSVLQEVFSNEKSFTILETGIGTGKIGIPAAIQGQKYNATVIGFDISKPMLSDLCKSLNKEISTKNLKCIIADANAPFLSFKSSKIHACFMIYFLHHIFDWHKCLDEAIRILKYNGLLIFSKEVSQWTYFIDANFNLTELGNYNKLLYSFWSYYHKLRDSIVRIPFRTNSRPIYATNYSKAIKYLKRKGMTVTKIPQHQKFFWKRKFTFRTILEIIKFGDYPPLAWGLNESQKKYLGEKMLAYLMNKEIAIDDEITTDSYLVIDLLKK